jgi:hypothetical protein
VVSKRTKLLLVLELVATIVAIVLGAVLRARSEKNNREP